MIIYDPQHHYFSPTQIDKNGAYAGFSTSYYGDGRNGTNLRRLIPPPYSIVRLRQTHSTNIHILESYQAAIEDTDGVITDLKNVALTAVTADCVPIVFADMKRGLSGISHQGWKGSLNRLAQKMVMQFHALGTESKDLKIAIGPAINECCYHITAERASRFMLEFPHFTDKILKKTAGHYYLNLLQLNYLQLIECGTYTANIDFFPFCTQCDSDRFFSFRRDGDTFEEIFSFVARN